MDLRQLEYIVTIADSRNVTEAAEKLFISQSGLNQQLMKLEKELGLQLFERGKRHFHITKAGEVYVQGAREILKIRRDTYSILSDIRDDRSGEISLGLTHEHGIDLFTAIYPEFHQSYPGVRFHLLERVVRDQQQLIRDGQLDCGILLLREEEAESEDFLVNDLLYREDLVLGIPLSHPYAGNVAPAGELLHEADLKDFRDDTFSLIFETSTQREIVAPLFKEAGFTPHILIETMMNHALVTMVSKGFCCTILPHSRILANPIAKNCAWFRLKGNPTWGAYLTRRRDMKMSRAYRYFRDLAIRYGEVVTQQCQLP